MTAPQPNVADLPLAAWRELASKGWWRFEVPARSELHPTTVVCACKPLQDCLGPAQKTQWLVRAQAKPSMVWSLGCASHTCNPSRLLQPYHKARCGRDADMLCRAATLTTAQMEFRRYLEIQPQEAAEFVRMLAMHYRSFENREDHQQTVVKLAAALADGPCALLKFVYEASRKLPRRLPLAVLLIVCGSQAAAAIDVALRRIC